MTTYAIVGSRHWTDYAAFVEIVERHIPRTTTRIVSGGAAGGTMAERLAKETGLSLAVYPPEPLRPLPIIGAMPNPGEEFTRAAHRRNQRIVDEADGGGIALPGPKSKGTYDTIRRAKAGPNADRWTVVKVPE